MQLDPVTLEILNNKFLSIANEMSFTLMRAGRTLYVKETADFSTALVNLDGKFFAYPDAIGVAGFVDLDCSPTIRYQSSLRVAGVVLSYTRFAHHRAIFPRWRNRLLRLVVPAFRRCRRQGAVQHIAIQL